MIDDDLSPPSLKEIPQYGIWHTCLAEAAFMIAYDQWYSFGIPKTSPDATEEQLRSAIEVRATAFRNLLVESVEKGRIKAKPVRRTMDGKIYPDHTYICKKDVSAFLVEFGYVPGDRLTDWIFNSDDAIEGLLCDEIKFLRAEEARSPEALYELRMRKRSLAKKTEGPVLPEGEFGDRYKALTIENHRLKERIHELESMRPTQGSRQSTSRLDKSLERAIGALVECILGEVAGIDKHPSFSNQTDLCTKLGALYDGYDGMSYRNLSTLIPRCRKILKSGE